MLLALLQRQNPRFANIIQDLGVGVGSNGHTGKSAVSGATDGALINILKQCSDKTKK